MIYLDTHIVVWLHVGLLGTCGYAVKTAYFFGSGLNDYEFNTYFQTDTTFTIPASKTTADGYYFIDIYAFSGPSPSTVQGNIEGTAVKGRIYSLTYEDFALYLGTGSFDGSPVSVNEPEENRAADFMEIISELR